MSAIVDAFLNELDDDALTALANRLRPFLDRAGENRLLSPAEAAQRLGVHAKTLTRAAAAGRVHGAERVGRSWRFRADGLALEPPAGVAPAPAVRPRPAKHARSTAVDAIRGRS